MATRWLWLGLVVACAEAPPERHEPPDGTTVDPTPDTDEAPPTDTGPDTGTGTPGPCGTYVSATTVGSVLRDGSPGAAVAADGTTWITVSFGDEVVLDPGGPAETRLVPANGGWDTFLARYDATGALLGASQIETEDSKGVFGSTVSLTSDGGAVLVGGFTGDITFARGLPNETTLTNYDPLSSIDVFVARYDATGALLWVRQAGSALSDSPEGVVVLSDDDVLVVGMHGGPATFGAGEPDETVLPLTADALTGGFLARFDADGSLEWAQAIEGSERVVAKGVAADASDRLTVVGYAEGPGVATVAPGQAKELQLDPGDGSSGWVGRWGPDGTLDWFVEAPEVVPRSVTLAPDGSTLLGATFNEDTTLGAGQPTATDLTTVGIAEMVLARFDPEGALVWATQSTSVELASVAPWDLVALDDGTILVAGQFEGKTRFGVGLPTETDLMTTQDGLMDSDAFVARFGPAGAFKCAWSIGGSEDSEAFYDLQPRPDGTWLLSGTWGGELKLGAGQANQTKLTTAGSLDALFAVFEL